MGLGTLIFYNLAVSFMATKAVNIYQFKITLKYITPKIWRRIQVPWDYNFWDLHVAIQDAMGWEDYHRHQFDIIDPKTCEKVFISSPNDEGFHDVIDEHKAKIAKYFLVPKDKAIYEYDFGDGWEHEVLLEKILPAVVEDKYPQCLAGKNACPPEDCGGASGYEYLLEILANPGHEEYTERMEWLGGEFIPEEFDPKLVKFDDPKKRWKESFR
jgi:hypothetical protein